MIFQHELLAAAAAAGGGSGTNIANSLRVEYFDGSNPDQYLYRNYSTDGGDTWTMSFWFKQSTPQSSDGLFCVEGSGNRNIRCKVDGSYKELSISDAASGLSVESLTGPLSQSFSDTTAWYHFVLSSNAGTGSVYVNGKAVPFNTAYTFSGLNSFNSNTNHYIFRENVNPSTGLNTGLANIYIADFYWIDGTALDATDFGTVDSSSGSWVPITYSGSYGTNGSHLTFSNSSNLGEDSSGNGNNWTLNDISSVNQSTDTPSNNVAIFGFLDNGNLATDQQWERSNRAGRFARNNNTTYIHTTKGTHGVSSGKWYCEAVITGATGPGGALLLGATSVERPTNTASQQDILPGVYMSADPTSTDQTDIYIATSLSSGSLQQNNSGSISVNDVIGIELNADDEEITFYINNVQIGATQSYSSLVGNNPLAGVTETNEMCFAMGSKYGGSVLMNFASSEWVYSPSAGYLEMGTNNFPEPVIKNPTNYYQSVSYTGNGATQDIAQTKQSTFTPDLVWIKNRTAADSHIITDSVRGTSAQLSTDLTNSEQTATDAITSFLSDGFSVGDGSELSNGSVNDSSTPYISMMWRAGGATSPNSNGSISSTVSANASHGVSIVSWTGTGSNGTVGHGLTSAPNLIIVKNRDTTDVGDSWPTYMSQLGATKVAFLSRSDTPSTSSTAWNNTAPTSSVFTVGTNSTVNNSGDEMIAYCFSEIAGYSKMGTYAAQASTASDEYGPFVYCGFRPSFVMIRTTSSGDWYILDSNLANVMSGGDTYTISPNSSFAQVVSGIDSKTHFFASGFCLYQPGFFNSTTKSPFMYVAFAESPFKYAVAG